MRFFLFVLIVFLSLSYSLYFHYWKGDFTPIKSYGVAFNKVRKRLGIPLIEKKWQDIDPSQTMWHDTSHYHLSKILIVKQNFINSEIDEFKINDDSNLVVINNYDRNSYRVINSRYYVKIRNEYKRISISKIKYKELLNSFVKGADYTTTTAKQMILKYKLK